MSLSVDLGNDRMLAAHYRKNAKHYGDRAQAIDDAVAAAPVPASGPREED